MNNPGRPKSSDPRFYAFNAKQKIRSMAKSVNKTDDPVVVNPETDSKKASTKQSKTPPI